MGQPQIRGTMYNGRMDTADPLVGVVSKFSIKKGAVLRLENYNEGTEWNLKESVEKIIIKNDKLTGFMMVYFYTTTNSAPGESDIPFKVVSFRLEDASNWRNFSEAIKAHKSKKSTRTEAAKETLLKYPPIMGPGYKLTEEEKLLITPPPDDMPNSNQSHQPGANGDLDIWDPVENQIEGDGRQRVMAPPTEDEILALLNSAPANRNKRYQDQPGANGALDFRDPTENHEGECANGEIYNPYGEGRNTRRLAGSSQRPALGAPALGPLSLTLLSAGMILGGVLCFRCFRKRHRARLLPEYYEED